MAVLRGTTRVALNRIPGGVGSLIGIADCNWYLIFMFNDTRMKLAFQAGGELD